MKIPVEGKVLIADYSMDADYDVFFGSVEEQKEQASKLANSAMDGVMAVETLIEGAFQDVFGQNFTENMTPHCGCTVVEQDGYTEKIFSYAGKPFIQLGEMVQIGDMEKGAAKIYQKYKVFV